MSQTQIDQRNQRVVKLHQQGLYPQAIELGQETYELARAHLGTEHASLATCLNNLAMVYLSTGDMTQAELLIQRAIAIWRTALGEMHPNVATALNNLAEIYREMGKYAQAEPLYAQSLAIRKSVLGSIHSDTAISLHNLAELYRMTGKYAQAEPLYEAARTIWLETVGENHPLMATLLSNMALLSKLQGDYLQAGQRYQHALTINQALLGEHHPYVAIVRNNMGELAREVGDYAQAEQHHQQAYRIRLAVLGESHPHVAVSLNNLATLYFDKGEYAQAERYYQEALSLRERVLGTDHPLVADTLNNLTLLYHAMSNHAQAEASARRAYALFQAALGENHPLTATALNNLACLYISTGDYAQAETLLAQVLDLRRHLLGATHADVATTLNNLASCYQFQHNYTQAEQYFQETLAIRRKILGPEHLDIALSLHNLAALHAVMGNVTAAESLYHETLDIQTRTLGNVHPHISICLTNLAMVYAARQRTNEALATLQQATLIDDQMLGQVFSISSEKQRLLYLASQQKLVNGFLSLIRLAFLQSPEAARAGLLLVLRRKGLSAEALAMQRDMVLGGRYPHLRQPLHELTLLRRQIAQKLLTGPGQEEVSMHQQLLAEWMQRCEQMEMKLVQQIPEMELTQRIRMADTQAISRALPQASVLVEFVRFALLDFQAVVGNGEKQWQPDHYAAFVLPANNPEQVTFIDLGEAATIDHSIARFREVITGEAETFSSQQFSVATARSSQVARRRSRRHLKPATSGRTARQTAYTKAGKALREMIFDPLKEALQGQTHLFFAPDSDLNRLPFEILPLGDEHFLIDDYHITYLNTGRDALLLNLPADTGATESLVVADPDFDLSLDPALSTFPAPRGGRRSHDVQTFTFRRLPSTRQEGEQVSALLGVHPHMQKHALERVLKTSRSPRILHIATHGFFLPDQDEEQENSVSDIMQHTQQDKLAQLFAQRLENPLLRSGLTLAGVNTWSRGGQLPAEAEDGLLTAEDVSGLDLSATDLVVLSACETGLGEIHVGEGVFGLRRAFTLAGAKTLIMSLWKVPDRQTQELMEIFYQHILQGQFCTAALRAAQLEMKRRYRQPYYWGAFICQGNARPFPE